MRNNVDTFTICVFILLNNKKRFAFEVITDQINRFVSDYDPSIPRHPFLSLKYVHCAVYVAAFFLNGKTPFDFVQFLKFKYDFN